MKKTLRLLCTLCLLIAISSTSQAQVKLEDIPFDLNEIFGKVKVLKVKKGFSPVFSLGNYQVNTVGLLGEKLKGVEILGDIFNKKNVDQVNKLFKTYKTGLVVYKVLTAAGTALSTYSTIRGLISDSTGFNNNTVKTTLISGLTSVLTGVLTKILTKKASYKAVDIFNGVARKTIKDIFSIQPASSTLGVGLYVKL
ncbi:MAG TPA: hypothetical protein VK498_06625 [Ferruginibacter sp.]|nr:hypothetical protein [Ferruginibacter sp.]